MMHLRFITLSAIALLIVWAAPAQAEIYSFVDSNGVIHLTDRPQDPRYNRYARIEQDGRRVRPKLSYRRSTTLYNGTIKQAARRYGLEPALVRAVIRVESDFDPNTVSHKGAVGLMQLMPGTARMYGVKDSTDPTANIYAGSKHLRYLLKKFRNDLTLSLAAYNAGEGTVARYGNRIPPYRETRNYVTKVLRFYRQYSRTLSSAL
uniref:Putative GH23: lytic transglycosylase n=1 Tax=Magnetococcus massalia (strain MO-1) TaxID=451514 RepID=A0A1S7LM97_MAGMO|nr:Putative GH23 : lytic transglycosylase [Candidatus Magnetococcus massalia]